MHNIGELPAQFPAVGVVLLIDLVADAPQNHARMIAVTADKGAQVLLVPVGEKEMIISRPLRFRPAIERLRHHDKSHPVAQFQQLGRRRIVAGANRVAAHRLQQLKLARARAQVESHAQRTKIVVQAHAVDLHSLTIQ